MPDSAITTSTERLSRPGVQVSVPDAPASRPSLDREGARSLTELAHDEWCELCDDLERWLDG